jgi:Prokaryotic membrane lipoprotein lipid attachment site
LNKGIIFAIGAAVVLAGCQSNNPASNVPVQPKWKGAPYHISFDAQPTKPNPAGIAIPIIKYTANPDAVERRASLVVRFDTTGAKTNGPLMDQMIMAPVDISGTEGALPADYMAAADQGLSKLLGAYCMKGKIKVSVLLAQSTISSYATDDEINDKRLSDWLPIELVFKNPHPRC